MMIAILPAPRSPLRRRPFSPSVSSCIRDASPISRPVADPAESFLVDLEDHDGILVGHDPDSGDYVADSERFAHPQRGRTRADAVGKVRDLLEMHDPEAK